MTTDYNDDLMPTAPWPVRWPCDVSTSSPTATGNAVAMASSVLWALTGRQFGYDSITLRPCNDLARSVPWVGGWLPWPGVQPAPIGAVGSYGMAGWDALIDYSCSTCSGGCSCTDGSTQIKLPGTVSAVLQVKIDGTVLASSSYHVDDNRWLVRTDGYTWPLSNNLLADDTHVGTWSVQAQYGKGFPPGAADVIGELGCELIRAMNGEDCRLPRTVTSIARQGVTISMPDPNTLFTSGLTGLYLTDLFIRTWNPHRLVRPSKTYNIDRPTTARRQSS